MFKIYEDNALGRLPDSRYAALDAQYAKEQDELSDEIDGLEKAISGFEQSKKSAEKFIALVEKYENFDTMTTTMLNEFVEKILVHERARKGSIETTQEVEIYFNFVGHYVPPHFWEVNLTPEGTGGPTEERGTQGQAAPELSAAQGQRKTKGIRGQNQDREAPENGGQESGPPRRGHGERRVLYRGQHTAAGAAERHFIDTHHRHIRAQLLLQPLYDIDVKNIR